MKEKNILIIGNGYDLALFKQTSYNDFIKFASQIVCFSEKDLSPYAYNGIYTLASKPNDKLELKFEDNKKFVTKRIIKKLFSIFSANFLDLKESELNILYKYSDLIFQDVMFHGFENTFNNYRNLLNTHIIRFGYESNLFLNFIDESFDEMKKVSSKHELNHKIIYSLILNSNFYNDEIETLVTTSHRSQYQITDDDRNRIFNKFFGQFTNNKILKFIISEHLYLENWNSLEHHISELSKSILTLKENISDIDDELLYPEINITEFDNFINPKFKNFPNSKHIIFILSELAALEYDKRISKISILNSFNKELKLSLDLITYLLEFYLSYVKEKEKKNVIINEDMTKILNQFKQIDNMVTFNYTEFAQKNLHLDDFSVHYIHGKENFLESSIESNNIVFGIEDEDNLVNTDIIDYQKTFQRIIKKTGFHYKNFISQKELKKFDICRIIIFGHSLDILDKEIFLDFFNKELQRVTKVEFFIFYYGNEDLKSKVRNLSSMLGKDTLISLSSENYIHFIDITDYNKAVEEVEFEFLRFSDEFHSDKPNKRVNYNKFSKIIN